MLIIRCGLGGLGIRARICTQCAPWPLALVLLVVVLSLRIAKLGCRYSSYRVVAVMTWVVCRIMSQACVSFSNAMRRGSACVTCVILREKKYRRQFRPLRESLMEWKFLTASRSGCCCRVCLGAICSCSSAGTGPCRCICTQATSCAVSSLGDSFGAFQISETPFHFEPSLTSYLVILGRTFPSHGVHRTQCRSTQILPSSYKFFYCKRFVSVGTIQESNAPCTTSKTPLLKFTVEIRSDSDVFFGK